MTDFNLVTDARLSAATYATINGEAAANNPNNTVSVDGWKPMFVELEGRLFSVIFGLGIQVKINFSHYSAQTSHKH